MQRIIVLIKETKEKEFLYSFPIANKSTEVMLKHFAFATMSEKTLKMGRQLYTDLYADQQCFVVLSPFVSISFLSSYI